jgi:phosphoglycerate-specific signal transduction histidine kinase
MILWKIIAAKSDRRRGPVTTRSVAGSACTPDRASSSGDDGRGRDLDSIGHEVVMRLIDPAEFTETFRAVPGAAAAMLSVSVGHIALKVPENPGRISVSSRRACQRGHSRARAIEGKVTPLRENGVRRACTLTQTYADKRGAVLKVDKSFTDCPVLMSPIEIEQVFVNLIRNAIESRPNAVIVEMQDNGEGLPADSSERIFDPFFTSRLEEGGTGLPLSIAHGIIEGHGGSIHVESEARSGTLMRVELPISAPPADQEA